MTITLSIFTFGAKHFWLRKDQAIHTLQEGSEHGFTAANTSTTTRTEGKEKKNSKSTVPSLIGVLEQVGLCVHVREHALSNLCMFREAAPIPLCQNKELEAWAKRCKGTTAHSVLIQQKPSILLSATHDWKRINTEQCNIRVATTRMEGPRQNTKAVCQEITSSQNQVVRLCPSGLPYAPFPVRAAATNATGFSCWR